MNYYGRLQHFHVRVTMNINVDYAINYVEFTFQKATGVCIRCYCARVSAADSRTDVPSSGNIATLSDCQSDGVEPP